MSPAVHRFCVRVYYEDTDAAGIVYHANYLRFAERARTEMLRTLGLDHDTLWQRHGLRFAVRHCAIDYLRPARLDDLLTVATSIGGLSGARLLLRQEIGKNGDRLVDITVLLVALDGRMRPVRLERALPPAAIAALRADAVTGSMRLRPCGERTWTS